MERENACRKERLIATENSAIFRCQCGAYHVRVNGTTLQLTASQFDVTARLFKLALGMSVGQFDTLSGGKRRAIDVTDNINYVNSRV